MNKFKVLLCLGTAVLLTACGSLGNEEAPSEESKVVESSVPEPTPTPESTPSTSPEITLVPEPTPEFAPKEIPYYFCTDNIEGIAFECDWMKIPDTDVVQELVSYDSIAYGLTELCGNIGIQGEWECNLPDDLVGYDENGNWSVQAHGPHGTVAVNFLSDYDENGNNAYIGLIDGYIGNHRYEDQYIEPYRGEKPKKEFVPETVWQDFAWQMGQEVAERYDQELLDVEIIPLDDRCAINLYLSELDVLNLQWTPNDSFSPNGYYTDQIYKPGTKERTVAYSFSASGVYWPTVISLPEEFDEYNDQQFIYDEAGNIVTFDPRYIALGYKLGENLRGNVTDVEVYFKDGRIRIKIYTDIKTYHSIHFADNTWYVYDDFMKRDFTLMVK